MSAYGQGKRIWLRILSTSDTMEDYNYEDHFGE